MARMLSGQSLQFPEQAPAENSAQADRQCFGIRQRVGSQLFDLCPFSALA
jgi:hypothetical protein